MKKILHIFARTVQISVFLTLLVVGGLIADNGDQLNHDGYTFDDAEAHQQMIIGTLLMFSAFAIALVPDLILREKKLTKNRVTD